jgi:predicted TIM-barrel fold metal-dependent hydrolase
MDANNTEAQLCFPTVPRFCGQIFLESDDKDLAHLCLRVYNDWVIDEWCGGPGHGRLIPNVVVPLWDADFAAAEIRRCAGKGSHAVAFSEAPVELGLPSLHSGCWDPFLLACEETETVINMHVGSSSKMPTTAPDAPFSICAALIFDNVLRSMVDWILSGVLERYPRLRIAYSEGQVGWMPFVIQRLDSLWNRGEMYDPDMRDRLPNPPSSYINGRVYGCVFDDLFGLQSRDVVGMGQIMFETDYPHSDSTFPESAQTAQLLSTSAGLSDYETWQFLRGNAIQCYRLDRLGIGK